MARQLKANDVGLAEIDRWHRWFVDAHTQRLKDSNLPPDQFDRDVAEVTAIAAAIRERMRSDFLARRA